MAFGRGGGTDLRATGVLHGSGGPGSLLLSYTPIVLPYTYLYTRIPPATQGEKNKNQ